MTLNTRDLIPFAAQYEAGALNMGKADVCSVGHIRIYLKKCGLVVIQAFQEITSLRRGQW